MPALPSNLIGTEVRKTFRGHEWVVRIVREGRFELTQDGNRAGTYASLTAAAHAVRGDEQSVNGWSFFGLRNPVQRVRSTTTEEPTVKIGGKCQHEGCYEPADCKHGFCSQHCQQHSIGSYGNRKHPRNDKPHVGVEVEVVYARPEDFRRGVGIECHRDGSLGTYGAEYKVLALAEKAAAEAAELVHELWKRRARVNRSCGLHVHLDVRQLSAARVTELLDWCQATQDAWFTLVPPSRQPRPGFIYCERLTADNRRGHFTWAHTTTYGTVEFRLHGGTLNPYKIAGWITALVHLQAKAGDASYAFPDTGDAEADFWAVFADCPAAGKEYLATRKASGGVLRDLAFGHIEE